MSRNQIMVVFGGLQCGLMLGSAYYTAGFWSTALYLFLAFIFYAEARAAKRRINAAERRQLKRKEAK